jgi:hypothetical protein
MAPKAEWTLVLAAFALSVPLWLFRGGGAGRGDVVEEPITLVPEDSGRLACMRDRPVGPYYCAYRTETDKHAASVAGDKVIAPYLTTERTLYLVADLFDEPSVSRFVSRHVGGGRFTALCKLRLVEMIRDYELRFRNDTPWGKGEPAWVVEPLSCVTTAE